MQQVGVEPPRPSPCTRSHKLYAAWELLCRWSTPPSTIWPSPPMADKLARKRAAPILAGCPSNAANANFAISSPPCAPTGMAGGANMGWYNWPVCRLTICAHIMRRG